MNYTVKENVQMLIYLLKENNIKKIIISPGTTNLMFVASIHNDPFFDLFSAPDERSASYMACGLAAETGEIVVITCTGATASRNYMPGLTEAYYRKLPIFVITFILDSVLPGQLSPQVIDRSVNPNDVVKMGVEIPEIKKDADRWKCNLMLNMAILELTRGNPGPVHVNLRDDFSYDFSVDKIPDTRVIQRIEYNSPLPRLDTYKSIGVFIGSHNPMIQELQKSIEKFCAVYCAVVLTDHTSNYYGKYKITSALVAGQEQIDIDQISFDLLIDIGSVTGDYYSVVPREVWRIDPEGKVQDRFKTLSKVFAMEELLFFEKYVEKTNSNVCDENSNTIYNKWKSMYNNINNKIPNLPFSNFWCAQKMSTMIPDNSVIHFGILNSLRAWNFFNIQGITSASSNVGGFGIDGGVSTIIGASLGHPERLYFLCIGDLAFFYDMNSIGNRHVSPNLRILIINNGCGTEFKHYSHPGNMFGKDTDRYIAAAGHYGNKSRTLLKHYAEDLGFMYLKAENKEEFLDNASIFTDGHNVEKPMLFEVFTSSDKENDALKQLRNIVKSTSVKQLVKNTIGDQNVRKIMLMLKK